MAVSRAPVAMQLPGQSKARDGQLLSISLDGATIEVIANTGERPLGIETLSDGRLLVCDAEQGLLRVDPDKGSIEPLVTAADGWPMRLCDNAAVANDGTIYFSDSSRCHDLSGYQADLIERTSSGRLLCRNPNGDVQVLLDHLQFANGVALAADESFVAVAETGAARIVRLWLNGARDGQHDTLANLPGLPDNVSTGHFGVFWIAVPMTCSRMLNLLQRCPHRVRRLIGEVVSALDPAPPHASRVLAIDATGQVLVDIQLGERGYRQVSGVRERGDALYLGSLFEDAFAVISPLPLTKRQWHEQCPASLKSMNPRRTQCDTK